MIPLQIFHSQNSEAGYRQLAGDAVEAHMNMVRIWGGGLYQEDALYDIADRMGLLIWQEAMFACAQYPVNSDFLDNVSCVLAFLTDAVRPLRSPTPPYLFLIWYRLVGLLMWQEARFGCAQYPAEPDILKNAGILGIPCTSPTSCTSYAHPSCWCFILYCLLGLLSGGRPFFSAPTTRPSRTFSTMWCSSLSH